MSDEEQLARWMVDQVHEHGRRSRADLLAGLPEWAAGVEGFDGRTLKLFRGLHAGQIRWISAGQYWESLRTR
jgi:hypothetical protein